MAIETRTTRRGEEYLFDTDEGAPVLSTRNGNNQLVPVEAKHLETVDEVATKQAAEEEKERQKQEAAKAAEKEARKQEREDKKAEDAK